jgi:hypothetical protein
LTLPFQVVFTLRAVQYPSSIPVSLVSLGLIQETSASFSGIFNEFLYHVGSVADRLSSLRKLYEAVNIANKIPDGNLSWPENPQTLCMGVSVEFR